MTTEIDTTKLQVEIDATLDDILCGKTKAPMDFASFSVFCSSKGVSNKVCFAQEILKKSGTIRSINAYETFIYNIVEAYFQNGPEVLGIPLEAHTRFMTHYPLAITMAEVGSYLIHLDNNAYCSKARRTS